MFRKANSYDAEYIKSVRNSIEPFDNVSASDIKEVYVFEDEKGSISFLCTSPKMRSIVAVGGQNYNKLIRYFQYHRLNLKINKNIYKN